MYPAKPPDRKRLAAGRGCGEVEVLAAGQNIWCVVTAAVSSCVHGNSADPASFVGPSLGANLSPNGTVTLCSVAHAGVSTEGVVRKTGTRARRSSRLAKRSEQATSSVNPSAAGSSARSRPAEQGERLHDQQQGRPPTGVRLWARCFTTSGRTDEIDGVQLQPFSPSRQRVHSFFQ